jgi:hypothetical protein
VLRGRDPHFPAAQGAREPAQDGALRCAQEKKFRGAIETVFLAIVGEKEIHI